MHFDMQEPEMHSLFGEKDQSDAATVAQTMTTDGNLTKSWAKQV
jgi:hypothetical protein